jgi:hypothetical protein
MLAFRGNFAGFDFDRGVGGSDEDSEGVIVTVGGR